MVVEGFCGGGDGRLMVVMADVGLWVFFDWFVPRYLVGF